jgi:hypothetical protein
MGVADGAERQRRLCWSAWRRAHQASARSAHVRRRAGHTPPAARLEPRILDLPETVALTDEGWERILPLLPPQKPAKGRPARDHRTILEGILWIARTGAPWREVPTEFGPWETIHSRYRRWRQQGLWPRIIAVLHPTTSPPEPA